MENIKSRIAFGTEILERIPTPHNGQECYIRGDKHWIKVKILGTPNPKSNQWVWEEYNEGNELSGKRVTGLGAFYITDNGWLK